MAAGLYGAEYELGLPPIVDHYHECTHQHHSLLSYLARRHPGNPNEHPNYPNVDVRDTGTDYQIEAEVPGIKNVADVHCRWTSSKGLIVSGEMKRPSTDIETEAEAAVNDKEPGKNAQATIGTQDAHSSDHAPHHGPRYLLVGEGRIGYFWRIFYLPLEVEMEKLSAKLEVGLLCLRVPKHEHAVPKGDGKIEVESME